ncbi:hypothetical protein FKW77_002459 [Venturia effusa]|uniref:Uncharacterized protein n=1 Tax=Venturia effusa TaxID=50376 RepID=A0A517LNK0_9PEZI|nr:hypothetical protein FKW77_002459 [Venturia effusa]
MASIPARNAERKQADTQVAAAETSSETSRTSTNNVIFSDHDSISQATNQTDLDSDSDLSTSSEDPSSDSEDGSDDESDTTDRASIADDEGVTNLRPGTKPNMQLASLKGGLLQRLKTFIPELAAANQELDKERLDGTIERRNIEQVDEGEGPFIELDLGLGVLEEKSGGINTSKQDSDSEPDSESDSESDPGPEHHVDDTDRRKQGPDVLGRLMGQAKKEHKSVQIQELGE